MTDIPETMHIEPEIEGAAPPPRARTLGELLRTAREARGMTLPDIAARTRIPERTLAAIEADAYEQLPHTTFAAGFIRSLAREVGVPEPEAMTRYRAENTRLPPPPMAAPLRAIEPERVPSRRLAWASAIVVILVIAGAVLWFARDRGTPASPPTLTATTTSTEVAATPPSGTDPTAPAANPSSPPVPSTAANTLATGTTAAAPPPPALGAPDAAVTLTAKQDVWLQVRDKASSQRVISTILTQGQRYGVPPGDMQLWTGRAGAIEVRVNGRLLPPLGGPVETVRNVDLTPAALVARAAGAPADANGSGTTSASTPPAG